MVLRVIAVLGLIIAAAFSMAPQPARAALQSYSLTGATDPDCAVQVLGGTASCFVTGSFKLHDTLFGTPQFGLEAEFKLFVNGSEFDSIVFSPFALPDPEYCTEYCNEVTTDAAGNITGVRFSAVPGYAIGKAVFITESGWDWSISETGNGLFSNAKGVVIENTGPAPVPLPATFGMLGAAVAAFAALRRRRGRS